jgi:hypothetical protein
VQERMLWDGVALWGHYQAASWEDQESALEGAEFALSLKLVS